MAVLASRDDASAVLANGCRNGSRKMVQLHDADCIITPIPNLIITNILTKFGADWLIFLDARVLTQKLWMDGRQKGGWTGTDGR